MNVHVPELAWSSTQLSQSYKFFADESLMDGQRTQGASGQMDLSVEQ